MPIILPSNKIDNLMDAACQIMDGLDELHGLVKAGGGGGTFGFQIDFVRDGFTIVVEIVGIMHRFHPWDNGLGDFVTWRQFNGFAPREDFAAALIDVWAVDAAVIA